MKRQSAILLTLIISVVWGPVTLASMYVEGTIQDSSDYVVGDTAWDDGANTASFRPDPVASGGATFSIMGAGFDSYYESNPPPFRYYSHGTGVLTQDITALGVSGYTVDDYAADISAALDVWASVSGFTNLGLVADGGVDAAAPQSSGGHLGDIRVAAWEIDSGDSGSGVLAHAYYPSIEGMYTGGTIGGDVHFDVARTWVDDPFDTIADDDFDFFTVALHELGHSLGLDHSDVFGSVMYPIYGGALRSLTADDIAGIQAIYGLVPTPGAVLLGILGLGVVGIKLRKYA